MTTAATYAEFGARETRGISPTYELLAVAVSRDGELISLLDLLPPAKRQPNLLFGVVRFLGGQVDDPATFHDYVTDPADLAWLEALIWPEHAHRLARLRAAAAVVAVDPPLLVRGDLVDDLPALAAQAPADATLVIFHTSVLYQVPPRRREAFVSMVRALPGHWIANEDPDVLTYAGLPAEPDNAIRNVLALDGTPLAWTRSHGQSMTWFG